MSDEVKLKEALEKLRDVCITALTNVEDISIPNDIVPEVQSLTKKIKMMAFGIQAFTTLLSAFSETD